MKSLEFLEKIVSIFTILFYSDAFFTLLKRDYAFLGSVEKIFYYGIPLLNLFLILICFRTVFPLLAKEKLLWILISFMLCSIFWSSYPAATLKQSWSFIRVTLFGIYFATRYDLRTQINLLIWSFGISAVFSFIFGLLIPYHGVMGAGIIMTKEDIIHTGKWQGIYTHKNFLGRMMSLASLIFFAYSPKTSIEKYVKFIGIGLSILLIILSKSSTALVISVTLISLIPLLTILRWKYKRLIIAYVITILSIGTIAIFLLDNIEPIFNALGKDMTMTGRTEIWSEVYQSIQEKLWFGYGYGAFWTPSGAAEIIWNELKFQVAHSHNGLLDALLDLGIIGTGIFLVTFTVALFKSIAWVRQTNFNEGLFPLSYLLFTFLSNLTESSLIKPKIYWSLFVIAILMMHHKKLNFSEKISLSFKEKSQLINS